MKTNPPTEALINHAKKVLDQNNQGGFTVPSVGLYPHQVLWDSCFIAIGYSHYDLDRARSEILSLFRGQWENGMIPHIIFKGHNNWHSSRSPLSPKGLATSGVSQPPMIAEAIVHIGNKLSHAEKLAWYKTVYPKLLAYHKWFYKERLMDDGGLVVQVHPWETGLDNSPPSILELHSYTWPWWLRMLEKTHLDLIGSFFRLDRRYAPARQRSSNIEALALYVLLRKLWHVRYDNARILAEHPFAIQDVTYNSILVRANSLLKEVADTIGQSIPPSLARQMELTASSLQALWDEETGQYYSRDPVSGQLIKVPTFGTFMPLYAGSVDPTRTKKLLKLMADKESFATNFPIPTVPIDSKWFKAKRYWQGPTWVNVNWLIIDGLRRQGYEDEAERLTRKTLEAVQKSGFYEYFDPHYGTGAGTKHFSWTAALTIDLALGIKT